MRKDHLYWRILFVMCAVYMMAIEFCSAQTSTRQIFDEYNFSAISINSGLPSNYINNVYKDSQGFIWLSTHNGLSRYDGYSFVNYNVSSFPIRLTSNFVNQVCEDPFHRLWIASEAGLSLLDLKSNKQIPINYNLFKSDDLSKEAVWFIISDKDKSIWLATQTNLYHISFNNNGKISHCSMLKSKYDRHSAAITALRLINNQIWLGYNSNIYRVCAEQGQHIILKKVINNLSLDNQTIINAFCIYNNDIWVGTNKGVYRYYTNSHRFKCYELGSTDIAVTQNHELVVASQQGLNFYDGSDDKFIQVTKTGISSQSNINCNFISCLYSDCSILWVGTEIGGLEKMESRSLKINLYTNDRENPESLSDNPVSCIFEDTFQNLWIGNVNQGLSIKYKNTDLFTHINNHNTIYAITQDDRNQLWFATWGGGLECTPLSQHSTGNFTHFTTGNSLLRSNFIQSVYYDKLNEGIWIGTTEGLSFYDLRKKSFINIILPTDNIPKNSIVSTLIDSKQQLWLGTLHGLIVIDLFSFAKSHTDVRFKYMPYKLDRPKSDLIEKICCIFKSTDGNIWIGSNGNGLYKLIAEEGNSFRFKNYTIHNGLCDNTVLGIVEDSRHDLWLSTDNGLSCYNPHTESFTNYYQEDGLLSNQFYWNAYCKATDNTLYFGGINGMIGIKAIIQTKQRREEKVVFTSLTVLNNNIVQGGSKYISNNITWANKIHLHERDKSFSLAFSTLDYANANNIKYFYRLKGFDEKWIECDQNHPIANYTNLKAGNYIFQVKVKAPFNTKSSITELPIIVSPFFYKTWWFWSIIFILLTSIAYYWYQWRIASLNEQKRILTEKVKERTIDLEEKMGVLSQQNDILTKQKGQLIELSKRIQEVTADKISFFTNITHEFRTPITLILGPLNHAINISQNPKVKEQLDIVKRNSQSLLSLVNQLLDFRKVESGHIYINKSYNDLSAFINNVIIPFEAFAKDRQIKVSCLTHISKNYYLYDNEWMQKVLVNLLSNAIKFTPDGGEVKLYVYTYTNDKGAEQAYISVCDTGVGILKEDLEKIFDRFYQSRLHIKYPIFGQSGTGIGLYVCKRIINEHNGNIYARNNHRAGSSFRIIMPMKIGQHIQESEIQTKTSNDNPTKLKLQYDEIKDKKAILVVDDNADMRTYIHSILIHYYNILEASGGENALTLLKEKNIDFIISDLMMPGMDGIELSRRIKNDLSISHIPILMLTAKISDEAKLESYKIGVDEYIQKPFSEELLTVRINNILKSRQAAQHQFDLQMNPNILNIGEETKDSKFLKKVMDIIEDNYNKPDFDVNAFAQKAAMSKTLLNQKLQNLIGQSTSKFISNYRLKKAQTLIEINKTSKNMNVSEIAYEVGFNDPKYFSRCYLKKYGILPSVLL